MSRMLVVGNGFDLAHGLPTRYKDMITELQKQFTSLKAHRSGYPLKISTVFTSTRLSNILLKANQGATGQISKLISEKSLITFLLVAPVPPLTPISTPAFRLFLGR